MRLVVAGVLAALATAVPAQAAPPDLSKYVTVEEQDPVNCVRFPCPQPMPYVVCVLPDSTDVCTPR